MAKKKRQKSEASPSPAENPVGENSAPSKFPFWLLGSAILLIAGVGSAIYLYKKSPVAKTTRPIGNATACQKIPPFARALGFGQNASLSTSDRRVQGLVIFEGERVYQHPSWKIAGSLAPLTRDGNGNVYAAPAPWIDVLENKPEDQNKVYKIDGQTQEMKLFADLPKAAAPTSQNPFGALGLAFDCETNGLYVSSVAGSTRDEIKGRIFQLAPDGKILSQLEKTDAIGLAVFNSAQGRRLFFGQARNPEIWSIALDDQGGFSGVARREVSLENLGTRGDDKARRINFANNEMTIFGIEFGFNLIAPSEKQETVYKYIYNPESDSWFYVAPPPQLVSDDPQSRTLVPPRQISR